MNQVGPFLGELHTAPGFRWTGAGERWLDGAHIRAKVLCRWRARPADELPPLAEAKLAAPRLRAGMVQRPRVIQALDGGADAALTLVAAPAGYGKTTAVRAWCARSGTALAWVTLDAGDNDPTRFWTYIATAVDRIRDGLGRRALHRIHASGMPIETAVDELMNGIAAFADQLTLVLDDLVWVTNGQCLGWIAHAVAHFPVTARLILITPVDPALELGALRASGELVELRADDLAFRAAEAHVFPSSTAACSSTRKTWTCW